MKIKDSISYSIVFVLLAVVVGYLAYLDSSLLYTILSLVFLVLACSLASIIRLYKKSVSKRRQALAGILISLIIIGYLIYYMLSGGLNGAEPLGVIGLIIIFIGILSNLANKVASLNRGGAKEEEDI